MSSISGVARRVLTVDEHASGERYGVVRLEDRRSVRREHRDALAVPQPVSAQRVGEPVAALLELAVGDAPAVLVRHRHARGMHVRGPLQERDRRQLAAVDSRHARTSTQR